MRFLDSPDSLYFHMGLAKLKPALGGGWVSFGDIIMYKKSLALSLWGRAVSSSAAQDVLGSDKAMGTPELHLGLFPLLQPACGQGVPGHHCTQGWCPLLPRGLVSIPDYPVSTDGRGRAA